MSGNLVELWIVDPTPAAVAADAGLLSAAERSRAAALASDRHRQAFVATRSVLRRILGEVPLTTAEHGKPVLAGGIPVEVSVSHTAGRSLVAVACDPVGVDIERTDRRVDVDRVAPLVLTAAERRHLQQLDATARRRTFVALWARKEALAKGVGLGLRLPFPTVDGRGPTVRTGGRTWSVVDVDADAPYAIAVAVPGPRPRIQRATWRSEPASPGGNPS
jgi:4'-phosphopantetheinyl transferase